MRPILPISTLLALALLACTDSSDAVGIPPECEADATRADACGQNGRGLSRWACDADTLQWTRPACGGEGEPSCCDDPDVCVDDAQDNQACGLNGNGLQHRNCVAGAWSGWSTCGDPDTCKNGAMRPAAQITCGINARGTNAQVCVDGRWGPHLGCDDPDVCPDFDEDNPDETPSGSERIVDCPPPAHGEDAQLSQRCTEGQWPGWGDQCFLGRVFPCPGLDGAVFDVPCGLNDRGTRQLLCADGEWRPQPCPPGADECIDGCAGPPDECVLGTVRLARGCGINGRGLARSSCPDGRWMDDGCLDPDECVDGESGLRSCRSAGVPDDERDALREYRRCIDGRWSGWSVCFLPEPCSDPPDCQPHGGGLCVGERSTCADDPEQCSCVAPTCDDGLLNGDEVEIDCGGETCDPCPRAADVSEVCNGADDDEDDAIDEGLGSGACPPDDPVHRCCGLIGTVTCDAQAAAMRCLVDLDAATACEQNPACNGGSPEPLPGGPCRDVDPADLARRGRRCDVPLLDADGEPIEGGTCAGIHECDPETGGLRCFIDGDPLPEDGLPLDDCPREHRSGGQPELCNERDDDLDGIADNGLPVGLTCAAGVGPCRDEGSWACDGDGGLMCTASALEPGEETCNGVDDDCDGLPDAVDAHGWCASRDHVLDGRCAATEDGARCVFACAPFCEDTNDDPSDGCETCACGVSNLPADHPPEGAACSRPLWPDDPTCQCLGTITCEDVDADTTGIACDMRLDDGRRVTTLSAEDRAQCQQVIGGDPGAPDDDGDGFDDDCDGLLDEDQ